MLLAIKLARQEVLQPLNLVSSSRQQIQRLCVVGSAHQPVLTDLDFKTLLD